MGNANEAPNSDISKACLKHNYKVGNKIGSGGFGQVYKAKGVKDQKKYAIKVQESNKMIEEEIEKLKLTSMSKFTVCLYDEFEDLGSKFLVMEFCQKGSLKDLIDRKGNLSEEEALIYFEQICEGVKYLHENRIIHRDLKPDNILIAGKGKKNLMKISDFGISKIADTFMTLAGTREYLSPEYYLEITESVKTNRTDIWALGCILFEMVTGRSPFIYKNKDNQWDINEKNLRSGIIDLGGYNVSEELTDILKCCLNPDYRTRIDIESLLFKVKEILTIRRLVSSECVWFQSIVLFNSKNSRKFQNY